MAQLPYPQSLGVKNCDPYVFDTSHFEGLLGENAKRIFVPDNQLQIKLVEVGQKDWIFTTPAELHDYLHSATFKGTRIFLIPQRYSWDYLTISENGLRQLLDFFGVFPAFIDVLCAFGKSTSETSDSLGGCYGHQQGNVSELCYLAKNVEKHGREGSDEPWSIRQLGLYHRHEPENDTFIILNPMISFQQRLKDAQAKTGAAPTWRDIHMLAISHATWQWRWYLSFWETKLSQLVSKAHVSRVEGRKMTEKLPVVTIEYSDFQDVQLIHDRMNMAKYILGSNISICEKLQTQISDVPHVSMLSGELHLQKIRVENLLERTRSGSGLMQDIISFRGLDALKISSENSNEMARLADIDSKNMVKLTAKSQRDAGMLKKISILTTIYLPASLVSVSIFRQMLF
ncbi:uncharacterized protein BDR25DRAFT_122021 [Lindgomyces ingoldianus]|uniref:Uncharacterized protein n=1 Tax=Lindgomyces ingoldianus TaxID=673940 RepID=A0ACB6R7L1_9PLEO|nr:uncharacterized protein BDR25DRAFT_122021 [Lindgomyces ingoldianus]KAF2474441.1 hypothetical protein BDR25DRAFT_122021 [Lindgomyces ingoldianus]